MLKDKIEKLFEQAGLEKWKYPQVFDGLKAMGVTHYETLTAQHSITYFAQGKQWKAPVPADWQAVPVGKTFDKDEVLAALRRSQTGQTNYPTFLKEIAAAGCSHYTVDMAGRTVTYLGDHGEQVVEAVPAAKG